MKILKSFFLFCLLTSIFYINSIAQIVYTDVMPDSVVMTTGLVANSKIYQLDLNNDSAADFDLTIKR